MIGLSRAGQFDIGIQYEGSPRTHFRKLDCLLDQFCSNVNPWIVFFYKREIWLNFKSKQNVCNPGRYQSFVKYCLEEFIQRDGNVDHMSSWWRYSRAVSIFFFTNMKHLETQNKCSCLEYTSEGKQNSKMFMRKFNVDGCNV